ncbi:hypothetical protein BDC45DRAFT_517389 [Circinella umbellata]|nr:hypothetical protein BDC45DRAFT_517389 [Circinella umbellata]
MFNDRPLKSCFKSDNDIIIVSPLPIRPLHPTHNTNVDGISKEQEEDARSELLEIMTPGSKRRETIYPNDNKNIIDVPASPVYRTLNPLPHDTSFIHAAAAFLTVQNAMAAMAAVTVDTTTTTTTSNSTSTTSTSTSTSTSTTTTTRTRSYSVGDDRNKLPTIVC